MRPQSRGIPTAFHGYRATLPHSGFETGEDAFELEQSAGEAIVHVARLRNSPPKIRRRGIGIALDDCDLVDDVTQHAGGAHTSQTAADHQSASRGHGPVPIGGGERSRTSAAPLMW